MILPQRKTKKQQIRIAPSVFVASIIILQRFAKVLELEPDFGTHILCYGFVKILANPSGFAPFCALPIKKSVVPKFCDPQRCDFWNDFW
ncbi:MAG: hypothetical protein IJ333_04135 [Clostridia bacterium]|nr:hypothetical protein [Clostridia bacterium]